MALERTQDELVLEGLQALGVAVLTEWDVLTFIYGHAASLCTAAQIARLVGYDRGETGVALQRLEALGLIERSRVAQGVRFYRLSASVETLRHMMNLTRDRAGRLSLLRHLKRTQLAARRRRESGLRLA
jgi:DNA-binding MarR family transcriptional regulator